MKKSADFCNFCKKYVYDESEGVHVFKMEHGLSKRIFNKSTLNDVCICNQCQDELKELL